jgi:hypothetical protein
MSTRDDQHDIDALLKRAGADWRRQQPPPPEPDLSRIQHQNQPNRRWLLPALAAASVAAVAVMLTVLPMRSGGERSGPSGQGPQQSSASDLIVHDGDTVEVTGQVIAAPGQPVVFCPPRYSADDPQVRSGETPASDVTEPAPTCPTTLAVTLTGVDVDQLSFPVTVQGTRAGQATLRGTWHGRSIDVTEQTAPKQTAPTPGNDVPCPAPSEGWKVDNADRIGEHNALDAYVRARPDRFSDIRIANLGPTSSGNVAVLVVPVVSGEVDSTRRELKAVYQGNLCVTRGVLSIAEGQQLAQRVGVLMNDNANSISAVGQGTHDGRITVALFMVTERLYEQFTEIGLDKLQLDPVVRPLQ